MKFTVSVFFEIFLTLLSLMQFVHCVHVIVLLSVTQPSYHAKEIAADWCCNNMPIKMIAGYSSPPLTRTPKGNEKFVRVSEGFELSGVNYYKKTLSNPRGIRFSSSWRGVRVKRVRVSRGLLYINFRFASVKADTLVS